MGGEFRDWFPLGPASNFPPPHSLPVAAAPHSNPFMQSSPKPRFDETHLFDLTLAWPNPERPGGATWPISDGG